MADIPSHCGTYEVQFALKQPAGAVHVIERSARMADHTYDHDGDPNTPERTPWSVLREALEPIAEYEHIGQTIITAPAAGADNGALACLDDVSVLHPPICSGGQAAFAELPDPGAGPETLVGGAPLVAAYDAAIDELLAWPHEYTAQHALRVILSLHTPANCEPGGAAPQERLEQLDPRLLERVTAANEEYGIYTYVLGVDVSSEPLPPAIDGAPDGVSPFDYLNELAVAGGVPKDDPDEFFYNADVWHELAEALERFGGQVISCDVPIEDDPPDPDDMRVWSFGVELSQVELTDCDAVDGWAWVSEDYSYDVVRLCGEPCALYTDVMTSLCTPLPEEPPLYIEYGCPK